jgi:hypothetical protein
MSKKVDIIKKPAVLDEGGNAVIIEEIIKTEKTQTYTYNINEIESKIDSLNNAIASTIDARDRHVAMINENIVGMEAQRDYWIEKRTEAEGLGLVKHVKKPKQI